MEQKSEELQRFVITNPDMANWALRKIRALTTKVMDAKNLAQAEIDRIKEWEEAEVADANESIKFFHGLLEEWHRKQLLNDPKQKTIKLPYGQLQMRAQQPEYIRDEAKLRPWLEQNMPQFLVPQAPKLDWASLKKSIIDAGDIALDPETGEHIPGIQVEQREPKFTVKVDV